MRLMRLAHLPPEGTLEDLKQTCWLMYLTSPLALAQPNSFSVKFPNEHSAATVDLPTAALHYVAGTAETRNFVQRFVVIYNMVCQDRLVNLLASNPSSLNMPTENLRHIDLDGG